MKEAAKPYRNQRVSRPRHRSQQHLLEVSIRASKARQQRIRRVLGVVFKLLVIGGAATALWFGAQKGTQRYFWQNPALFLSDIRVDTDGTLTREQIIAAAGVLQGENIFRTNLTKVRQALDRLPQVERVEIQRTLPNRLDISITERQPIAWIVSDRNTDPTASDKAFLVDARGYVMKTRKLLPVYYHLPIISGVETENLVAGQKVSSIEVQSALELLRLNADSTRWQVRNVDVSKGYCLVVTDRKRAEITFGLDDVGEQLTRLYRLLDHFQTQEPQPEIRTVNLFVERNIPVTFADSPESETPSRETAQETRGEERSKPASAPAVSARAKTEAKSTPTPTPSVKQSEPASSSKTKEKSSTPSSSKKSAAESVRKPFRM